MAACAAEGAGQDDAILERAPGRAQCWRYPFAVVLSEQLVVGLGLGPRGLHGFEGGDGAEHPVGLLALAAARVLAQNLHVHGFGCPACGPLPTGRDRGRVAGTE
jgi:hypothetical protein